MKPKVIAFDVFGTVFDLSSVAKSEIAAYGRHIHKDVWEPLELPESWKDIKAHPDSKEGIDRLRKNFQVVTCSNGPIRLLSHLSKANGLTWDALVPLEMRKVYKPNPLAYLTICGLMGVECKEVMMVTANRTFGDLEAAQMLGMQPMLIRDEQSEIKNIIHLADWLERRYIGDNGCVLI